MFSTDTRQEVGQAEGRVDFGDTTGVRRRLSLWSEYVRRVCYLGGLFDQTHTHVMGVLL